MIPAAGARVPLPARPTNGQAYPVMYQGQMMKQAPIVQNPSSASVGVPARPSNVPPASPAGRQPAGLETGRSNVPKAAANGSVQRPPPDMADAYRQRGTRECQPETPKEPSVVSDINASSAGADKRLALDRRIAWIEEDVGVLQRRLRDEVNEGKNAAVADSGLRSLIGRLDGELSAEKRSREAIENRIGALENLLKSERHAREASMLQFTNELEATMRALIGRIDEGLAASASVTKERTELTEARLRSLIKRVDEGLSTSAAALQDTLGAHSAHSAMSMSLPSGGSQQGLAREASGSFRSDGLSWDALQRQASQDTQAAARYVAMGRSGAGSPMNSNHQTPSTASPYTMQVPGSGLRAAGTSLQQGNGQQSPWTSSSYARGPLHSPVAHARGGGSQAMSKSIL